MHLGCFCFVHSNGQVICWCFSGKLGASARIHLSREINSIGDSASGGNGRVGEFEGHGGILM